MTDPETREAVAACRDGLPDAPSGGRLVFGFDGYVDRVRTIVADRQDADSFDRLETLAAVSERLADSVAAGSSLTFEWVQNGIRTGGHTCHLGRAFGTLGFDPVMVGMYGRPVRDVFAEEFGAYTLHSMGEPGETDAVEFDDGKLMLTESGDTLGVDWDQITGTVGRETLADHLDGARLMGVGYWSETPDFPGILDGLTDLWTDLADPPGTLFVDTGDVRKLDPENLRAGVDAVRTLAAVVPVAVSANRAETATLADALADGPVDEWSTLEQAAAVRDRLGVERVVGHGVDSSVVAGADGTRASVAVPRIEDPVMTTSSGDHFNVGFALGLVEGLPDPAALVLGNAVAGLFVRSGESPAYDDVREFVEGYPDAF